MESFPFQQRYTHHPFFIFLLDAGSDLRGGVRGKPHKRMRRRVGKKESREKDILFFYKMFYNFDKFFLSQHRG